MTISWQRTAGHTYNVWRKLPGASAFSKVTSAPLAAGTYTALNVPRGTEFYVTVIGKDGREELHPSNIITQTKKH